MFATNALLRTSGLYFAAWAVVALVPDDGEELREAARAGDVPRVAALLDAGVPVDAPARHQITPLMLATERGHLEVVRMLVARGADVNVCESFFHSSILAAALENRQREIALFLLEQNARDRAPALQWAVENSDLEMAEAALAGSGVEALDLAVARKTAMDREPALRELLEKAVPVGRPAAAASFDPARLQEYARTFRDQNHVIQTSLRGDKLTLSIDGAEPVELTHVAESRFESPAGDLRLDISGRAGLVEWATLVRASGDVQFLSAANNSDPESLQPAAEVSLASAPRGAPRPWRQFRGAGAAGIGDGQGATADWDIASGRHVRFKTPLPGIALASPIVESGRIYVTTAVSSKGDDTFRTGLYGDGTSVEDTSPHSFRLYALDAANGAILWEREVANVAPTVRRHLKSSLANSTPATDGKTIVVLFGMIGVLAAYDREGTEIWRRDIGVLDANDPQSGNAEWGHASSPVIEEDLVIVQADRRRDSFLAAYDLKTGNEVWKIPRDEPSTWSTPTIVPGPAGHELVTNGLKIRAYRPRTGELLWSLGPNSEVVVATPVAAEGMVYVTAGYPPVRPVYAIRTGSSGDLSLPEDESASPAVAWSHRKGGTYIPTPILYRGHLITVNNNGVLTAYRSESGEEVYRARISSATTSFSSSPVAADGRLYIAAENGDVYILRGEPGYEVLARHSMGEVVMATPAISDGLLVIRTLGHVIGVAEDNAKTGD
jgi:outer membrane protein assembly factor BamB/ankyrin repeat protein